MDQPNIVFITCDQMRADAMGCADNKSVHTPHIDLLALKGVRFSQAYSPHPVCIPARATIMTGLEGHRLGITSYVEGFRIPVRDTLPQCLHDIGYETRVVGKMHTYPERSQYGFDSMLLCEEGRLFGQAKGENRGYDDYEQWLSEQGYAGKAFTHGIGNNEHCMSPWHLPDHLHPSEWVGNEACKAIKRRDWEKPLFLWTSFTAPHPPLTPLMQDLIHYQDERMPEPAIGDWMSDEPLNHTRFSAAYAQNGMTFQQTQWAYRAYYALITQVDRQINRILGTLREEGLLKNTWIVFTSDHGDNMGDHGMWHKGNFLQGSCNIPLLVIPPLQGNPGDLLLGIEWLPGSVCDAPVGLQDLMPTLLEIAGASIPAELDGKSVLPLISGKETLLRAYFFGEFGVKHRRSFMLTDGSWKYIWYEEDGKELLFHIAEDPGERFNRVAEEHERTQEWRDKLTNRLRIRKNDPALKQGELEPAASPAILTLQQKARLVSDRGPRGLH